MADPLSLADFADKLPIQSIEWQLHRWDEFSGLGSGDVLAAQLAPPRWGAKVQLAPMNYARAAEVQALIEALDGALGNFYLYAPQKTHPQDDPTGSKLGSASPKINTLPADNQSMTLKDLPAGYKLTVGDFLSYSYGSDPVRRALLRVCSTVTADAGGFTPSFKVRPHIPTGTTVNVNVTLIKPAAKVFIVPGSFSPGTSRGLFTEGMSFEVMQRP